MTDAKYQRCSEVETLELLVNSMFGVQALPVVCGGEADSRNRLKRGVWFNPSQHVKWFAGIYWRDPQACGVALIASPDASVACSIGYRLPITWGSSTKH